MSDQMIIKEAPHVRRWVLRFLESNPLTTLDDIVQKQYIDKLGRRQNLYVTSGFITQARKMLQEKEQEPKKRSDSLDFVKLLADQKQEFKQTTSGLCFTFRQRGKYPTKGLLLVTLDGENLLLDTFDFAKDSPRRRFINRLYLSSSITPSMFSRASLTQCLMEMAVEATEWGKPPAKTVKTELNRFDFEKLLIEHSREVPPCYIERTIQRSDLNKHNLKPAEVER